VLQGLGISYYILGGWGIDQGIGDSGTPKCDLEKVHNIIFKGAGEVILAHLSITFARVKSIACFCPPPLF
jgi:hypothetical protein